MNKEDKEWIKEAGKHFDNRFDEIEEKLHELRIEIELIQDISRCVNTVHNQDVCLKCVK